MADLNKECGMIMSLGDIKDTKLIEIAKFLALMDGERLLNTSGGFNWGTRELFNFF